MSSPTATGIFPLDVYYQIALIDPTLCNQFVQVNSSFHDFFLRYLSPMGSIPISPQEIFSHLKDQNHSIRYVKYTPVEEFDIYLCNCPVGPPFVRMSRNGPKELMEKYFRVTYQNTYRKWEISIEREGYVLNLQSIYSILFGRTSLLNVDPTYPVKEIFKIFIHRFNLLRTIPEDYLAMRYLFSEIILILDKKSLKKYNALYWEKARVNSNKSMVEVHLQLLPFIENLVEKKLKGVQAVSNGHSNLP